MVVGLGLRRRLRGVGWLDVGRRRPPRARGVIFARSARVAALVARARRRPLRRRLVRSRRRRGRLCASEMISRALRRPLRRCLFRSRRQCGRLCASEMSSSSSGGCVASASWMSADAARELELELELFIFRRDIHIPIFLTVVNDDRRLDRKASRARPRTMSGEAVGYDIRIGSCFRTTTAYS